MTVVDEAPPEEETTGPTPALFGHCQRVYREMHARSKRADENEESDGYDVIVYEGMITKLICSDLNYAMPMYTRILRCMQELGCIRQIRRGGSTTPSLWELIKEPDENAFLALVPKKRKPVSKVEMLADQVNSLTSRVNQMETTLDQLVKGLADA